MKTILFRSLNRDEQKAILKTTFNLTIVNDRIVRSIKGNPIALSEWEEAAFPVSTGQVPGIIVPNHLGHHPIDTLGGMIEFIRYYAAANAH